MYDVEMVSYSIWMNIKKKFYSKYVHVEDLQYAARYRIPVFVVHNGKRYYSDVDKDDLYNLCPYRISRDGRVIALDFELTS